jgi:hypothetical protein
MTFHKIIVETENKAVAEAVESMIQHFRHALEDGISKIRMDVLAKDAANPRKGGPFPPAWKTRAARFAKAERAFTFADLANGEKLQQAPMNGFIEWLKADGGFRVEKKNITGRPGRPSWVFSPKAITLEAKPQKKVADK